jgi:D-tyrosyl-tRNA(Tyr) deacylase
MKIVLQRSKEAQVSVDGKLIGAIPYGFVLLVGVTHEDTEADVLYLVEKIVHLRIFEDEKGKMNRSLLDMGGQILSVSQFTLFADCRKGRRPSFTQAAQPEQAKALYEHFNQLLRHKGVEVQTGSFGAMMDVELINWGPVTIVLDSHDR